MRTHIARRFFGLIAIPILFSFFAAFSFAQSDLTAVTGTVHDPTGAVVSGATVTIRNLATGAERKATTNAGGNYSIPSFPAGNVDMIVEAPGFKRYEQAGNSLQANVTATLDATLTLGQSTETVQVTSEAPPVQADSATLGRDITTKQIQNLQLNGRNPYLLSLLKPGVSGNQAIGGVSFYQNNRMNVNRSRTPDTPITPKGAGAGCTPAKRTSNCVVGARSTPEE